MPKIKSEPMLRPKLNVFIRNKLCCSYQDFARMINVVPATITLWIYSETMPKPSIIKRIAWRTGYSPAEVYDLFEVNR